MKLYKCTVYHSTEGAVITWHSNRVEAERALRNQIKDFGEEAIGPDSVELMNIETDKEGLLKWLNVYCAGGNA